MPLHKYTEVIQSMDAEVRRIIDEKNRVEAAKASLERDNNNLKVSEINFRFFVLDIYFLYLVSMHIFL